MLQVEKPYYAVQLIRYSTHGGLRMCKHLRYVRCAYDASINMYTTNMYTVISPLWFAKMLQIQYIASLFYTFLVTVRVLPISYFNKFPFFPFDYEKRIVPLK